MENIDDYYSEEIKKIDEEFLQGPKNGMSKQELRENYHKKLKKILETYKKEYEKNIANQEIKPNKKLLDKFKKEKVKPFKAEHFEVKLNWKEKEKIKLEIFKFKLHRKLRNLFFKTTPKKLIYSYFKIKIETKYFFREINNLMSKKSSEIKENFIRFIEKIKEKIILLYKKLKKKYKAIKEKFKKSKNSKEENKKDESKKDLN